jgi:hypothetical protein
MVAVSLQQWLMIEGQKAHGKKSRPHVELFLTELFLKRVVSSRSKAFIP